MGGGKKKDRQREDQLYARNQAAERAIQEKSPYEKYLEKRFLDLQAWEGSDGRDIRDMPGMSDYIQLGEAALERSNRERMGQGGLALSGNGMDGYAEKLKSLRQKEMGQEVGAGLERARAMTRAEIMGGGADAAQFGFNRQSAVLGNSGGLYQTQLNYKPKSWWDYLREGVGMVSGLAQGAGSAMSGYGSLRPK